jgi:DNA-binding GntR family transcriptional regulator
MSCGVEENVNSEKNDNIIVKRVLSDQIKENLISDIINNKYLPGDKLVESAIAKRFGVSQAPVREALKGLAEMGFVTFEPYKGTTVRSLSKEDIWETMQVRAVIEGLAARLAAKVITPKQVAYLEGLADKMVKAAQNSDYLKREEINERLHQEIIRISGNQLIARLSNTLRFADWSHAQGTFTSMDPVQLAMRHHNLIEPLKKNDPAEAERIMREHIEASAKSMLASYWKEDPEKK